MDDRPLSGDSEWLHQSIVLDVPPSPPSIGVAFGVILSGPGDVWIDDVVLEAVGSDVPPTKPSSPFGAMPVDSATMVARYAMLPMAPRNLGFENP